MDKAPSEPVRFGKYLLLERIGRGGMSEVFLAKSTGIEGFERRLALKRIYPTFAQNSEFVEGFIHEARVGGMLYHHNVVQTLDFGRCEDTLFIALEYVEGTHLGEILARCRERDVSIPPPVFIQMALQICEGLEYIHTASSDQGKLNLVHRDIKPSNMLVAVQGIVKISDFGVVKAGERSGGTTVGALKGTVGYMSPEQARGEAIGPTSDIFSLGAMLYEMATFRRIFGQGDLLTVLRRVKACDIQAPVEAAGAYIPGLERVLRRMLSPVPAERYQSAGDVSAALRALPVRVADRKGVVAFLQRLDLLDGHGGHADGGAAGGLDGVREPAASRDRRRARDEGPAEGLSHRVVARRQAIVVLALSVLLGLAAALGVYHLVLGALDGPVHTGVLPGFGAGRRCAESVEVTPCGASAAAPWMGGSRVGATMAVARHAGVGPPAEASRAGIDRLGRRAVPPADVALLVPRVSAVAQGSRSTH